MTGFRGFANVEGRQTNEESGREVGGALKKEHALFLLIGFAFGALFGIAVVNAVGGQPDLQAQAAGDDGMRPQAPQGQAGPDGGAAPMMAEIRALRKAIADDPTDHAAIVRLANLHHDINDFDNAIGYYEQALALVPDDPDAMTDMGICYRGKREFDRALELFRQASAMQENHWQSLFNIVIVTGFDLQQYDPAFEALETLEAAQPDLPQLVELRGALEEARTRSAGGAGS